MSSEPVSGINDLLPGLDKPLWEGIDPEFTAYARASFDIPESMTHISITPRGPAGRSAVAIDDKDGGLIFVLTPNPAKRKTHIRPVVAGPLTKNQTVVTRAHEFNIDDATRAIAWLAMRHLPVEVVRSLLMLEFH